MAKITNENLYNYFYIYAPEYYIWPLEVHLLNLLLHVTPEPTEDLLRELADVLDFSLDTPFKKIGRKIQQKILYGSDDDIWGNPTRSFKRLTRLASSSGVCPTSICTSVVIIVDI